MARTVSDLQRERTLESTKLVPVFNPDTQPFSVTLDINEDRNPVTFTVGALAHASFPPVVAEHVKHHLAKHLMHKENEKNSEIGYQKARERVEVTL